MAYTLDEARAWLQANLREGETCPCCGQFAKIYKRPLNASMALALILMEKRFRTDDSWLHVPSFLADGNLSPKMKAAIRGDWAKLKYWGLLEESPLERPDGSDRAGFYKITNLGRDFVGARVSVAKYVFLYNQTLLGLSDGNYAPAELTWIVDALGEKFNYAELMETS